VLSCAREPVGPSELAVYARLPVEPVRASGSQLWDATGRRFLDLYGGHAVAVSGHCHPHVVAAVREQAERLLFYSNAVPLEVRDRLVDLICELGPPGLDRVFFVNSGAEANEVAIQIARRITGRRRVVSVAGGFHGRTLATLAVSGIPHYRELATASGGTGLVDLTTVCPWNEPDAITKLVGDEVAAVVMEPVQGLAGARDASPEFLQAARTACRKAGALLIFDEVQCGCGRSGAFTAAQSYGVAPDILTLAKGIAGGLPMGAVLLGEHLGDEFGRGDLGTTFGGGPVPCAAAVANLEVIRDERLPERAARLERRLRQSLAGIAGIERVTGRGLLLGIRLDRPARPVQLALMDRGILVGTAIDPAVLRLLPPLVITEVELDELVAALLEVLR